MEEIMKVDVKCKKYDWKLFFAFSMAAAHMDPNDKKSVSWPYKWNQSQSQTQKFGNGKIRDWMLHWEQGQQDPKSQEGAAHHILISLSGKT